MWRIMNTDFTLQCFMLCECHILSKLILSDAKKKQTKTNKQKNKTKNKTKHVAYHSNQKAKQAQSCFFIFVDL